MIETVWCDKLEGQQSQFASNCSGQPQFSRGGGGGGGGGGVQTGRQMPPCILRCVSQEENDKVLQKNTQLLERYSNTLALPPCRLHLTVNMYRNALEYCVPILWSHGAHIGRCGVVQTAMTSWFTKVLTYCDWLATYTLPSPSS